MYIAYLEGNILLLNLQYSIYEIQKSSQIFIYTLKFPQSLKNKSATLMINSSYVKRHPSPLYKEVQDFDPQYRQFAFDGITWPIFRKKFWYDQAGQTMPHVLSVPEIYNNPSKPDPQSPFQMYTITDDQLIKYIKALPQEIKSQITQIEFEGASSLKGHNKSWIVPIDEEKEEIEEPNQNNSWIPLLDFDLVMVRICYSRINDWGLQALMHAPFWKRGYLQFLDLDHSLFIDDEMQRTFSQAHLNQDLYPYYEGLKYLSLRCSKIGKKGFRELLQSPFVKNLIDLDLESCIFANRDFDEDFFEKCNFSCLRKLKVNNMNLSEESFKNIFANVGHTIQYFFCNSNQTLILKENVWAQSVRGNLQLKGSDQCFRNLKVMDLSYNINLNESILNSITKFCDTDKLEQLRISNSQAINPQNIFNNRSHRWSNIKLIDFGDDVDYSQISGRKSEHEALYDIFYNSHGGYIGQREITIGERLHCITWPSQNRVSDDDEDGEDQEVWIIDERSQMRVHEEIKVERQQQSQRENCEDRKQQIGGANEFNELKYLVWAQRELHLRQEEARAINNLLKKSASITTAQIEYIVADIIKLLITPRFFEVPKFSQNKIYDINFEQYYSPID